MSFDIDISLSRGDRKIACSFASTAKLTALVGPSGIGKTSVLNAIAGLVKPRTGRICVSGDILFDTETGRDLPPELRRAGYVFQDTRLFPHKSVAANLYYGESLASPEERWISHSEVVALLDIGTLLDRRPDTLSGGEARRVAIGRALLSAPKFLLLDEPFAALDSRRAATLAALIERIRDELAVPTLLVSHSTEEVERLASHVVELGN